jgi:type IV pilus assembly protein PilO
MDLRLNKLPWYVQVGIFVALGIGGIVAFYYLYAEPAKVVHAQQQQRVNQLRAQINKGLATARKLPQFRADVADLEARLENLKAVLPDEKDFGDLLRSLQTLAAQSNLTIRVFKPGTVVTKQLHAEWPIAMELDGTYHNLGLFFDRISKFARIINVGNVVVRAKDRQDSNTTVSVACVATTFVLLEAVKGPQGAVVPGPALTMPRPPGVAGAPGTPGPTGAVTR